MNTAVARYFVVVVFICFAVCISAGEANAQGSERVWHWGGAFSDLDLPGGDYRSFKVESGSFPVCMDACLKDEKCRAYTFEGSESGSSPSGRCFLKNRIPEPAYGKKRCVSDYKEKFSESATENRPGSTPKCPEFAFTTKSPIPAVIGGHYSYQIMTSGGINPVEFCPMEQRPDGTPPRCDNSPEQVFSMPFGLKLSKTGQISGQVKCGPDMDPSKCQAQYIPILIQAKDSCPNSPRRIQGEFWINIRKTPLPRGN